jgi:hypothetical protein
VKLGVSGALGMLPAMRERESIYLRELEFGLFDGIADEELSALFPLEYAHYNKLKEAPRRQISQSKEGKFKTFTNEALSIEAVKAIFEHFYQQFQLHPDLRGGRSQMTY